MFTTPIAAAMNVNKYLSGSWYNPDQDGHGFSVEVMDDGRSLIYWYVYNPDGSPLFLVGIGRNQGNRIVADAYVQWGMKFGEFDPSTLEKMRWGEMTMTFHNCDNATISYDSNVTYDEEPFGSGSISLKRLASVDGLKCSDNEGAGTYHMTFVGDTFGFGAAYLMQDGNMIALLLSENGGSVVIGVHRL
jgi:hypothetical protein